MPILPTQNRVTHVAPITLLIECDGSDSRLELTRSECLDDLPWIAATSPVHGLGPDLDGRIAVQSDQIGKLSRNRYVVHNAWVVCGTRIPTTAIWNYHVAGYAPEAIVQEYPRLTPADVRAAIEFEMQRQPAA